MGRPMGGSARGVVGREPGQRAGGGADGGLGGAVVVDDLEGDGAVGPEPELVAAGRQGAQGAARGPLQAQELVCHRRGDIRDGDLLLQQPLLEVQGASGDRIGGDVQARAASRARASTSQTEASKPGLAMSVVRSVPDRAKRCLCQATRLVSPGARPSTPFGRPVEPDV